MTLEKRLREAAESGDLNYLSIVPHAGKGGVVFSAIYRKASGEQGRATDSDPAKAITLALDATEPEPWDTPA